MWDGTLTTSEAVEFSALLTGKTPKAHEHAATVLTLLADRGYRPFYLTARPEFLTERTRDFVKERGFPPGIVHTNVNKSGALGSAAATFKSGELALAKKSNVLPTWAFGNSDSDAEAYANAKVPKLNQRIFFQYTDQTHGGRRIESYGELISEVSALSSSCP